MAIMRWIGGRPVCSERDDYPAVGDVEKDVVYDGGAKTGTFKAPAESKVEKDVGYGEDDVEFVGTLVPQVDFVGEAIGHLEEEDNMEGKI